MSAQNNVLTPSSFKEIYNARTSSFGGRTSKKFYESSTKEFLAKIPNSETKKYLVKVLSLMPSDAFIAGGAGLAIVIGDTSLINDIDVYCANSDSAFAFAQSLLNEGFTYSHTTEFSVNFTKGELPPVSIIKITYFDNAAHCVDSFDYTVCQFAVGPELAVYNPMGITDFYRKTLEIHNLLPENDALYRLVKYVQKGYTPSNDALNKIHKFIKNGNMIQGEIRPTIASQIGVVAASLRAELGPLPVVDLSQSTLEPPRPAPVRLAATPSYHRRAITRRIVNNTEAAQVASQIMSGGNLENLS